MKDVVKAVSEILNQRGSSLASKTAEEIAGLVSNKLKEMGIERPLEKWEETKYDNNCTSGIAARTCYRVNHGDGTYSEIWCDPWHCV